MNYQLLGRAAWRADAWQGVCDKFLKCSAERGVRFPPVGVDQVLGLLKVIHNLGGRTDAMYINDAVDADLGDLAHVVDAAEFLGLLKASGGDLELTAAGRDAVERPLREFQKYLKRRLSEVEPFASLARFVSERGRVEVGEVLEFLSSFGYGEEGARRVLDWAVFAQIVEIEEGEWVVPS
jgi:hypothetical protein